MEDKLKQGEALFAEGKIEEAEKCFSDFLDQNPEDAEALNNLGAIYYTRGNVKEAEGYFFKALEAKEDYP
ncbi:MAG: tetratricopeptide repeat protein, partial [Pseudomonadota bacterium]